MKKSEQEIVFNHIVETMRGMMLRKGDDYSNDDRLSNFKLAGSICGISPQLNCLSLISTKVARLGVLLNSKKPPNNESIQDSCIDLANYALLLIMIQEDLLSNKPIKPIELPAV